jgi:hypothetical protein
MWTDRQFWKLHFYSKRQNIFPHIPIVMWSVISAYVFKKYRLKQVGQKQLIRNRHLISLKSGNTAKR